MLSKEEHTARAMLMGRVYIDWAHIYVYENEWDSVVPNSTWLHADDLHQMDQDEKMELLRTKVENGPKTKSNPAWQLQPSESIEGLAHAYDTFVGV